MGIWEKVKGQILENQGDISSIEEIPEHIRNIYKTSFTTSPYSFIEVAARAQKWVDQGLSRNMYLETRDIDETINIYKTAWEKGVKTTYYLHMKPRHTAEQSTVRVNKAEQMGKFGFAKVSMNLNKKEVSENISAPVAPFDLPLQKTFDIKEEYTITETETDKNNIHIRTGNIILTEEKKEIKIEDLDIGIEIEEKEPIFAKSSPKICPIDPAERAQCDSCQ